MLNETFGWGKVNLVARLLNSSACATMALAVALLHVFLLRAAAKEPNTIDQPTKVMTDSPSRKFNETNHQIDMNRLSKIAELQNQIESYKNSISSLRDGKFAYYYSQYIFGLQDWMADETAALKAISIKDRREGSERHKQTIALLNTLVSKQQSISGERTSFLRGNVQTMDDKALAVKELEYTLLREKELIIKYQMPFFEAIKVFEDKEAKENVSAQTENQ